MKYMQGLIAFLGAILTVMIILAAYEAPIGESFARITQDLWGWVALADLYLGFILFAVLIVFVEGLKASTLVWIIPLFLLGNIWSALWLVVRFNKIKARLGLDP